MVVLNLVVARLWSRPCHVGTHILQYHLPTKVNRRSRWRSAASAAHGRSGAASGHIWLLFSTSTDLILGLQCVTLFKQNSAPFLKTRFWLLSSAMLCLVIITLYFPTYGSTLQMNVGFWSPLPRASLRNAGRKVMIALLCQTLGRSIIKSYFNGTDIKKLIDESYT